MWFPAFALFHVGNRTGVQVTLVAVIVLFLWISIGNKRIAMDWKVMHIGAIMAASYVVGYFLSTDRDIGFNTLITYLSALFVWIIPTLIEYPGKTRQMLRGYEAGALISIAFAFFQRVGMALNLPFIGILHNNLSFGQWADQPGLYTSPRVFGFAPEPSIFAALVMTYIFYLLGKDGDKYRMIKMGAALICTFLTVSFSIMADLPVAFAIILITAGDTKRMIRYISIVLIAAVFAVAAYNVPILQPIADKSLGRLTQLFSSDSGSNASLTVRSGAVTVALQMAEEKPLFGFGMNTADEFLKRLPPAAAKAEAKNGVDNLPMTVLTKLGLFGLAGVLWMYILAIQRSFANKKIFSMLVCLIIALFLHVAGEAYYFVWALFGIALGSANDSEVMHDEVKGAVV